MTEIDRSTYTRVTSVIGAFTDWSFVSPEILEAKAEVGILAHKYIELILKGDEVHVVPEEIQGYLASFKSFWAGHSHAWDLGTLQTEMRLYDDAHRLTGQVDVIVKAPCGKTYAIDWKTSASYSKNFLLQAAAYKYLLKENGYGEVDDVLFVRLDKHGKRPALHKSNNYEEDVEMFFKCLDVYRWFGYADREKE